MENLIYTITLFDILISFTLVIPIIYIYYKWRLPVSQQLYAISRMLGQLLIVGYFLAFIFAADNLILISIILFIMILASSWIALSSISHNRNQLYKYALFAISIAGGLNFILITQAVLTLDPWYLPRYTIPLAGMIFANAMNSVSLAAERFDSALKHDKPYTEARLEAFRASMIPITNSLFAVGIVSLPGMMTGQILSGVSPLTAARYQIIVMFMIYSSAGLSSAIYLSLIKNTFQKKSPD